MMRNLRRLYTCLKKWSTVSMNDAFMGIPDERCITTVGSAVSTREALDDLYADFQEQRLNDPSLYDDESEYFNCDNFQDPSEDFMIARLGFHYVSL